MVVTISSFSLVVFSAGSGNRLRPLTFARPKLFVSLRHKTIYEATVEKIEKHGKCAQSTYVIKHHRHAYKPVFRKGHRSTLLRNPFPPNISHCGSSLLTAKHKLIGRTVLINSDLVMGAENIRAFTNQLSSNSKSFVCGLNASASKKPLDFQRVFVDPTGRITSWSLDLQTYNGYVTGPVVLSAAATMELKKHLFDSSFWTVGKQPCFSVLSTLIDLTEFEFVSLDHRKLIEVDTIQDHRETLFKRWVP